MLFLFCYWQLVESLQVEPQQQRSSVAVRIYALTEQICQHGSPVPAKTDLRQRPQLKYRVVDLQQPVARWRDNHLAETTVAGQLLQIRITATRAASTYQWPISWVDPRLAELLEELQRVSPARHIARTPG